MVVRVVRAGADALLDARGDAPAVAATQERAVDVDLEVAAATIRMDLEPARERSVGRLVAAPGEHSPPAQRVDDERRMQLTAVGEHGLA